MPTPAEIIYAEHEEQDTLDAFLCSPSHIAGLEGRHQVAVMHLEHAKHHKVSAEQDSFLRALAMEVVSLDMQLKSARAGWERSRRGK